MPPATWVVLPAYNEGKYLRAVLKELTKITQNVVVIDDGSVDQTPAIATEFPVHLLIHKVNLGKGAALKTGCEFAFRKLKAQQVVLMDSDNQHRPQEVISLASKLSPQTPIVLGVRAFNHQMPLARRIGSRSLSWWIKIWYGVYIPDVLSGFRSFTKDIYPKIEWRSSRYGVEAEMIAKIAKHNISYQTVSISTIYHDYVRGMTMLDALSLYLQLWFWRFTV